MLWGRIIFSQHCILIPMCVFLHFSNKTDFVTLVLDVVPVVFCFKICGWCIAFMAFLQVKI